MTMSRPYLNPAPSLLRTSWIFYIFFFAKRHSLAKHALLVHAAGYYTSAIPIGNAVDVNIRRVFFVSCTPTFIASMNYDGSDIEVVASTSADVDKPYDIALDPAAR